MTTLSVHIPVLETDRLVLREPRLTDLEAITAFGVSERARYVGGPISELQSYASLTGSIGRWLFNGFDFWTVEDKATGAVAGRVGVLKPIDWAEPELGWHIYEGFEGKGLACEAAMAVRDHATRALGLGPLISQIHPDNARSRRLAERMGATVEAEGEVRGTPCLIYRHPKEAA